MHYFIFILSSIHSFIYYFQLLLLFLFEIAVNLLSALSVKLKVYQ